MWCFELNETNLSQYKHVLFDGNLFAFIQDYNSQRDPITFVI